MINETVVFLLYFCRRTRLYHRFWFNVYSEHHDKQSDVSYYCGFRCGFGPSIDIFSTWRELECGLISDRMKDFTCHLNYNAPQCTHIAEMYEAECACASRMRMVVCVNTGFGLCIDLDCVDWDYVVGDRSRMCRLRLCWSRLCWSSQIETV